MPNDAKVWSLFADALSVDEITEGARVRLDVPGLAAIEGVVDCVSGRHVVGVHTAIGILMLMKGYLDSLFLEYHSFSDDEDESEIRTAFESWLGAVSA